jgi:hypothetical protein
VILISSDEELDGVTAYRRNGRSVAGLTKDQLTDIMDEFPIGSDAYIEAELQYFDLKEMEEKYDIHVAGSDLKEGDSN